MEQISFVKWIKEQIPNVEPILVKKYIAAGIRTSLTLLLTLLSGAMIETIFYEKNVNRFFWQVIFYLSLFLTDVFLGQKAADEKKKLQKEIHGGLRRLLYSKEIRANGKDLQSIKSGENLLLSTQDIDNIFLCLDQAFEKIVGSAIGMVEIMVIVCFYNYRLAIVISGFAIMMTALTNCPNKKYQQARKYYRKNHGQYINWINERLKGMRDIRIHQAEEMFQEMFQTHTNADLKAKEKIRFIEIRAERVIGLVSTIFTILFWTISAHMILYASLTVGFFYVIHKYFNSMTNYLSVILQERLNIRNYMPGYEKIRTYCELEEEQELQPAVKKLPIAERKNAMLKLKNISFSYENKKVIDNLTVEFEPEKMNVLVGVNGAGKTTLMNLILRFYQAEYGSIEYDDTDIREYSLNEWRQSIGYVQQDTLFFEGSLRDNIRFYAPDIREERIWEVLKTAGLYKTVMEWEHGIDTDIMRGKRLSEGQKQRLAIARIIAKKSKIIFMDEPTANLDYAMEQEIIADMKKIGKERILIIITHRNTVIHQADNIFVLTEGRILTEENLSKPERNSQ